MTSQDRNALISIITVTLVGAGVALAGSQGGARAGGCPFLARLWPWPF